MTSEKAVTKTFRLSDKLSVEMTVGPAGFTCEWIPDVPQQLTRQERRAYLRARQEMFGRLAGIVGGAVAVVDVDEDGSVTPHMIEKTD
jgi:hypothetical protein